VHATLVLGRKEKNCNGCQRHARPARRPEAWPKQRANGAAPSGAGVQDRALLERIALPANRSLTIEYR